MLKGSLIVKRFLYIVGEEVNVFVAHLPESNVAVIIDAGGFDEEMKQYISQNMLEPKLLFITHAHYDHIEKEKEILSFYKNILPIRFQSGDVSNSSLHHGQLLISLGEQFGEIYKIPGHTEDHIVLHLAGHLFTGDALFAGAVGGTDSPENYHLQLSELKKVLEKYPDETIVHPGHGPETTIGIERSFNPFLNG